jgi:hypothetical protein
MPDARKFLAGEMPYRVSRRSTLIVVALAFGLTFAIRALLDADSPTAKPAALKNAPAFVASAPGAETDPALAEAVSIPALRGARTPRKKHTRSKAVESVETVAPPAPRPVIPTATEPPAPTPTPQYVAPAPRYVAPRPAPTPKSTPAPEPTATPAPSSGEFDTIGEP